MKILMVNKFLYPKGGAETYFLKIGDSLKEQGHKVEYFGMYDEKNIVGNSLNLYTINMDFHNAGIEKFMYPFKIIYNFEAKRKIRKIIKHFKPDIIHLNNINFQLTPSIIEEAKKQKIKIVQTVHDYQMICPNHLLFIPQKNEICEKCVHGSKFNCAKNNCIHQSKIKSIIGSLEAILYKIIGTYKKVDTYICPSEFLESKLLENDIFKSKTKKIINFIDLKSQVEKYEKQDYVLYFGRLSEEKGFKVFLNVCKMLPQINFKIAGTGPLENLCQGIENVKYEGFKTGKDLDELIGKAKFSVYPSVWYENCPLSILESISLGTPVITANNGGMKELVRNNQTGMLVNKINEDELKGAIQNLYNENNLLEKMTENCFKERENMKTLKQYCEELIALYENLVEEK